MPRGGVAVEEGGVLSTLGGSQPAPVMSAVLTTIASIRVCSVITTRQWIPASLFAITDTRLKRQDQRQKQRYDQRQHNLEGHRQWSIKREQLQQQQRLLPVFLLVVGIEVGVVCRNIC